MATLEEVLVQIQMSNRVCPLPQQWQQLYEMLPNKRRTGAGWDPSLPLILAAWDDTPALSTMLRLREHIEWAATHNCIDEIHSFLDALPEKQWHHVGE